jgi:hypothetical protein
MYCDSIVFVDSSEAHADKNGARGMRSMNGTKALWMSVWLCLFDFLIVPNLLAADGNSNTVPSTGATWFFIAFGIAYVSRRRAIGGWLLYFYLQLYASLAISILSFPKLVPSFSPSL